MIVRRLIVLQRWLTALMTSLKSIASSKLRAGNSVR